MKRSLDRIINYFSEKGYLSKENIEYARNRAFRVLKVSGWPKTTEDASENLRADLSVIVDYAENSGLLEGKGISFTDDLIGELTDCLIPLPDAVTKEFREKVLKNDIKSATDWFYRFNIDTQYIKKDRTEKNLSWTHPSVYGDLDITVNLSKPEKTTDEIRLAATRSSDYPSCMLCKENVGLGGIGNPPRQHHRIIPVVLNGMDSYFQYSPYAYFNEHCIVFSKEHVPMSINEDTPDIMMDFVSKFPHYFLAGNTDLPIVGGSILSHLHFQGGDYVFPVEKAPYSEVISSEEGTCGILKWPVSAIKLNGTKDFVSSSCKKILKSWRCFSDPSIGIIAKTKEERHNTVNFFFRKTGINEFSAIILLRNNRCDDAHLEGIFHTGPCLREIKKENIGIIEAIGMAILPARLKDEMTHFNDLDNFKSWLGLFSDEQKANGPEYLIGETFKMILEDVGVFKQTKEGQAALRSFVSEALR